ncbi:uncharacterized protein Z519_11316 [Cladophialophora bantiana CBS 173.52]|uniref:AMP-dependent synthetase/ligase domain-containing protein n=1 Tax=Cladophialophora bantiana (strain ATCC 10958 / CBS 173.52 / CDC B-1940 / NIH 8579) TaxID=1442370 RepID=A0A0D2HBA5_CLAB1|nr:uncharacterized protein Z519_11316 [Cladophialophora bantiana CBS 173.52]KIW88205.1 hypothetical protein Z519_11316 [Cladophialophora bantiana CBS 173.52]
MIESPYSVSIPLVDVNSFVFSSGTPSSRQAPQYFDAARPAKCFSLADAEGYVKQVGQGLQKLGLQAGDRVLLYSNNRLYFPIVLWATIAAGCIFTAASPTASVTELEYQLRDSGAKLLLSHHDGACVALKAAARASLPTTQIYLFGDLDENIPSQLSGRLQPWTKLWSSPQESASWSWKRMTSMDELASTTAVINYSSGTTGLPKGVEISHYNLVANSTQFLFKRNLVADTPQGRARKSRLDLSGERWLAPLPMYHAYGQTYYSISAARLGAKVFIMAKFNVVQYLLYLDIYRITFMTSVPVILTMLCKQDNPHRFNLKAVEVVTSGSAPLDPGLGKMVEDRYLRSNVNVKQGWGLTETTCSITGFAPDDEDDGRSIGWLNPNCYAKIVPVAGQDFQKSGLANRTIGEIWVAGPNIMKGYWHKPKETSETIVYEDGHHWLRTGDIGYIDERGRIFIVDRLKELIKVKGLQVAPAELELSLLAHPDVIDAAVVGAKMLGVSESFCGSQNPRVTAESLFEYVKERFAPHKWLTGGVYFIDAIPRTGSGKVIRRALPSVEAKARGKL